MDEESYKKQNKFPACTRSPIEHLIPYSERFDTMRRINQEAQLKYQEDLYECPKRLVCLGSCMGRPLPDVPSAVPYLAKLKSIGKFNSKGELLIEGCQSCPIKPMCTKTCPTINSFLNRLNKPSPQLVLTTQAPDENALESTLEALNPLFVVGGKLEIPWEVLTPIKVDIIKSYLFNKQDFQAIAERLKFNNGAEVKYLFYSSLTKLSEIATFRSFINLNKSNLTEKQLLVLTEVYMNNKKYSELAILGLTKSSISSILKRVIRSNGIRWNVFVKKQGSKLIYNVPEILR